MLHAQYQICQHSQPTQQDKRAEGSLSQPHLISKEEHNSAGVVELVHRVEVRNFANVDEVNDGEVFQLVSARRQDLRVKRRVSAGQLRVDGKPEVCGEQHFRYSPKTVAAGRSIQAMLSPDLVHLHTGLIPVMPKTHDNNTVLFLQTDTGVRVPKAEGDVRQRTRWN